MIEVDPLLALLNAGRRLEDNNAFRAKLLATAARANRGVPFEAYCRQMIEWAQAEAVARYMATDQPRPEAPRLK